MKTIILTLLISVFLIQCGSSNNGNNKTHIQLRFIEENEFNPNSEHGAIDRFKITVTGDTLKNPIVKIYAYETDSVDFEDLEAGAELEVMVEAINYSDFVIRRGRSDKFHVSGGKTTNVDVSIFNVPIFSNVKDGSQVYSNRFVPKVFAPGGIQFQVTDEFNDSQSILEDEVSGESTFSISVDNSDSIKTVYSKDLPIGTHKLTVKDVNTEESTTIAITSLKSDKRKVLHTTSGNYLGSFMSVNPVGGSSLPYYHMLLTVY